MTNKINSDDSLKLCGHVDAVFKLFCDNQLIDKSSFFLSHIHTKAAIDNALKDLGRLKDFHMPTDDKVPDRHKIAGFVAKWIARNKPIQITQSCASNTSSADIDQILKLNASFAVHVFASFLAEKTLNNLAKYLQYWFEFRDERGETLAFVAFCCEEITRKQKIHR